MTIDLTAIIQAILGLLAALVTAYVIPWIKTKTNAQQQALLRGTVRTLVFAAEQIYGAGKGQEKLHYVQRQLAEHGFTIDLAEIEAAVGEMNLGLDFFFEEADE